MATSPTQLSLRECRKRGWRACVVEKWVPQAKRRIDAFGFGDLLVLDDEPGSMLVQACVTGDAPKRVRKCLGERREAVHDWLFAGNRVEVWGWAKRGKRQLWTLKRYPIAVEDV